MQTLKAFVYLFGFFFLPLLIMPMIGEKILLFILCVYIPGFIITPIVTLKYVRNINDRLGQKMLSKIMFFYFLGCMFYLDSSFINESSGIDKLFAVFSFPHEENQLFIPEKIRLLFPFLSIGFFIYYTQLVISLAASYWSKNKIA